MQRRTNHVLTVTQAMRCRTTTMAHRTVSNVRHTHEVKTKHHRRSEWKLNKYKMTSLIRNSIARSSNEESTARQPRRTSVCCQMVTITLVTQMRRGVSLLTSTAHQAKTFALKVTGNLRHFMDNPCSTRVGSLSHWSKVSSMRWRHTKCLGLSIQWCLSATVQPVQSRMCKHSTSG